MLVPDLVNTAWLDRLALELRQTNSRPASPSSIFSATPSLSHSQGSSSPASPSSTAIATDDRTNDPDVGREHCAIPFEPAKIWDSGLAEPSHEPSSFYPSPPTRYCVFVYPERAVLPGCQEQQAHKRQQHQIEKAGRRKRKKKKQPSEQTQKRDQLFDDPLDTEPEPCPITVSHRHELDGRVTLPSLDAVRTMLDEVAERLPHCRIDPELLREDRARRLPMPRNPICGL